MIFRHRGDENFGWWLNQVFLDRVRFTFPLYVYTIPNGIIVRTSVGFASFQNIGLFFILYKTIRDIKLQLVKKQLYVLSRLKKQFTQN